MNRDTVKNTQRAALGLGLVCARGLGQSLFPEQISKGIEFRIVSINAFEDKLRQFDRGDLLFLNSFRRTGRRAKVKLSGSHGLRLVAFGFNACWQIPCGEFVGYAQRR
ncbi:MAG TPA: hypothetical protein VE178_17580 [Silvibacterium sp.]|nr:hypothetical protein [Silvibacterium sp.]